MKKTMTLAELEAKLVEHYTLPCDPMDIAQDWEQYSNQERWYDGDEPLYNILISKGDADFLVNCTDEIVPYSYDRDMYLWSMMTVTYATVEVKC